MGWILLFYGSFKYFLVVGAYDRLWLACACIGIALIAASVIAPAALGSIEEAWSWVGKRIGKIVFTSLLTIIYFIFVLPIGLWQRKTRGEAPFYKWQDQPPANMEGWVRKTVADSRDPGLIDEQKLPLFLRPLGVLLHFARNGQFVYLPVLLLFLVLGILMFFASTSTLAPFIYTLF